MNTKNKKITLLKSSFAILTASSVLSIIPLLSTSCGKGDSHDYSKGVALTNVEKGDDVSGFKLKYDKDASFPLQTKSAGEVAIPFLTFLNGNDFDFFLNPTFTNFRVTDAGGTLEIATGTNNSFSWNDTSAFWQFPSNMIVSDVDWSLISTTYPALYDFCAKQIVWSVLP